MITATGDHETLCHNKSHMLHHLRHMNLMLTLCGSRLSDQRVKQQCTVNLVNQLTRSIIMMAMLEQLYMEISGFIGKGSFSQGSMMTGVVIGSFCLSCGIMRKTGDRIMALMSRITMDSKTEVNSRQMIRNSVILLILYVAQQFADSFIQYVDGNDAGDIMMSLVDCLIELPLYPNQHLIAYSLFYRVLIHLLTQHELAFLQTLHDELQQRITIDYRSVMRQRQEIMRLKQEFESLFSKIPFLQLSVLFITLPAGIAARDLFRGATGTRSVLLGVSHIMTIAFLLTTAILLINTVSDGCDQVDEMISKITRLLQRDISLSVDWKSVCGQEELVRQLQDERGHRYTGWRLFIVNRSLMLSFLSACVTFSVLLIQVASQWL